MTGLKKELGLFEVTLYGVGIILGAGIYTLIGEGAGLTGNSLWISFVIGAVIASFTGLSYAELATMFPKAGAEYVYVTRSFGSRILGFLIGWLITFTGIATISTVSLGFAGYFYGLFAIPILTTAIVLIIALSYLNYLGIKKSSWLNVIFTFVEISGLLLVIGLSFTHTNVSSIDYLATKNGMSGILAASALVFFAYIGFEDIANIAEETREPRRILSKAFILAISITTLLYVLTSIAALNLASPAELSSSNSPLALAVSKTFLGNNAFLVMSVIALFATANTVLVAMIVGSRMMYGMAREGTLPPLFSRVDKQRGTPYAAIIFLLIFSILFLFVGGIKFIANMTSLAAFLTFALVNSSLLILRFKFPKTERPFRSPLNIGKFSVLAFLGLISSLFMLLQFEVNVILFTLGIIVIGLFVYTTLLRKNVSV